MIINKDRLINQFLKLVSIDSPSFKEKQMGEYLIESLKSLGFFIKQDDAGSLLNGNCGNIYAFLEGDSNLEPLLFCVHMDTVEPSIGKKAIIDENGVIKSSGNTILGADDCAGIAAIIEALHTIKDKNLTHRPIEVLFTVAEEVYCLGAKFFDYSIVKSKEAYVLDLDGSVGSLAYQAPTILSFSVIVHGKSAHAGFAPSEGIHAIAVASIAISQLKMGQIDEETTVNIGTINGGLATNIVPESCIIKGEIRSFSHEKAIEQSDIVKRTFDSVADSFNTSVDFEVISNVEAYKVPLTHPVVLRFEESCKELNIAVNLTKTFGGSDNNHLAKNGIMGIVLATAMNKCHSSQEYTTIDELCKIAELTVSLMSSTL